MKVLSLHKDYLLVLQQISEDGEDDLVSLEETLRFDRKQLKHIVQALQHKGLIKVKAVSKVDIWLTLSSKGRRFMEYMWPESQTTMMFS
jgi:hypothetical protein